MSQDGVTNPASPDKLRPAHIYLKVDSNGVPILDENGAVQTVTEQFDDDDSVHGRHIPLAETGEKTGTPGKLVANALKKTGDDDDLFVPEFTLALDVVPNNTEVPLDKDNPNISFSKVFETLSNVDGSLTLVDEKELHNIQIVGDGGITVTGDDTNGTITIFSEQIPVLPVPPTPDFATDEDFAGDDGILGTGDDLTEKERHFTLTFRDTNTINGVERDTYWEEGSTLLKDFSNPLPADNEQQDPILATVDLVAGEQASITLNGTTFAAAFVTSSEITAGNLAIAIDNDLRFSASVDGAVIKIEAFGKLTETNLINITTNTRFFNRTGNTAVYGITFYTDGNTGKVRAGVNLADILRNGTTGLPSKLSIKDGISKWLANGSYNANQLVIDGDVVFRLTGTNPSSIAPGLDTGNWTAITVNLTTFQDHVNSNLHLTEEQRTQISSSNVHATSVHAPSNAEENVQSDWSATEGDAFILNKPINLSQFNNDAGFSTTLLDISGKVDKEADKSLIEDRPATDGTYELRVNSGTETWQIAGESVRDWVSYLAGAQNTLEIVDNTVPTGERHWTFTDSAATPTTYYRKKVLANDGTDGNPVVVGSDKIFSDSAFTIELASQFY